MALVRFKHLQIVHFSYLSLLRLRNERGNFLIFATVHILDLATKETRQIQVGSYPSLVVPTREDPQRAYVALEDGVFLVDLRTGEKSLFSRPETRCGYRYNDGKLDPQGRSARDHFVGFSQLGALVSEIACGFSLFCSNLHLFSARYSSLKGVFQIVGWFDGYRRKSIRWKTVDDQS